MRRKLRPVVDRDTVHCNLAAQSDTKSNHGSSGRHSAHIRTVICSNPPLECKCNTHNLPTDYRNYILRRHLRIKDQIYSNLWLVTETSSENNPDKLILHQITHIQPEHVTYTKHSPWILRKHKNGWLTKEASKECQLEWLGSSKDTKLLELLSVIPIENYRPLQSSSGKFIELWSTIF